MLSVIGLDDVNKNMQKRNWARRILAVVAAVGLVYGGTNSSQGAGTMTNCTQAALLAAISGGGTVKCDCDGTIILTNTVVITNSVTIDAAGRAVFISGGSAIRLFVVSSGGTLSLNHLGILNGRQSATNKINGGIAAPDGGAFYINGGILVATDCNIESNTVNGLPGVSGGGEDGVSGTSGETARGSAIFNYGGTVQISGSVLSNNIVTGGTGAAGLPGSVVGNGRSGGNGGAGGYALGGAIYNANGGSLIITASSFTSNRVTGATAGIGGPGTGFLGFNGKAGASGLAQGGAVFSESGTVTILNSTFQANSAQGAAGSVQLLSSSNRDGEDGPAGGSAQGGAVFQLNGAAYLTNCTFYTNIVLGGLGGTGGDGGPSGFGGDGGNGGDGGAGQGGAIFNAAGSVVLVNSTLAANDATGGSGGTAGQSGGGLGVNGRAGATGATAGGAVYSGAGRFSVANTILAYSATAGNVGGAVLDAGSNISSDATGNFGATGTMLDTDPRLGTLANNGGSTPTLSIGAGSPALDAGDERFSLPTDQRGFVRFGRSDIGSYEFKGTDPSVPSADTPPLLKVLGTQSSDAFAFTITGETARAYTVQASTNLVSWTELAQVSSTNTIAQFSDGAAKTLPRRFYRALLVPKDAVPLITLQPLSQMETVGASVTLTVAATGTVPLSYQWLFNGQTINGATNSTYVLNQIQLSQAGKYTVVVRNKAGSVSSEAATLTVNVPATPPLITTQPANQVVDGEGSAAFTVVATGTEPLSYQWNFNGGILAGATNSSLVRTPVQASQAGSYTVQVKNAAGSVLSTAATLTITNLAPTAITNRSFTFNVTSGELPLPLRPSGTFFMAILANNQYQVTWPTAPGAVIIGTFTYSRVSLNSNNSAILDTRSTQLGHVILTLDFTSPGKGLFEYKSEQPDGGIALLASGQFSI